MSEDKKKDKYDGKMSAYSSMGIINSLPYKWTPRQGLKYPLTLKTLNGESLKFADYSTHHKFIRETFLGY